MTGPVVPEVAPMTVFDLQRQLAEKANGRACSVKLYFTRGQWVATVEYAGGGYNSGAEATGTGADAEMAIKHALARLPGCGDV